ncbi:MAG: phytanoyl-CoA dioxygenase family protein [Lentisphaeria bacterium]|nr:phytanoyl-CoA dioxygenase family protein [Lentisphaeria bacterium]
MTKLTDEQLSSFQENGFIILEKAFNEDEIKSMRKEADFILNLMVNSSLANKRQSGRLDIKTQANGNHIIRKVQPINDLSLFLSQMSADDRLLDPMRQIMDDEPILMEEKLNYKQAFDYTIDGIEAPQREDGFPIHSDWAYYSAQNYPQEILSSAISMDDSNMDSGPIRVWPGSHKTFLEHEGMNNGFQVKEGLIDFDGGEEILAPAGSVMIFHSLLVHNSNPNTSGKPRRLMIYSHYPKAAAMGHDIRNGAGRLIESPYELEYMRKKISGEYSDQFTI